MIVVEQRKDRLVMSGMRRGEWGMGRWVERGGVACEDSGFNFNK